MDFDDFVVFWKRATEQERDERIFQQWLVQLPNMDNEHYTSFEEYRDKMTGANIDTRSRAEIIKEIEDMHKKAKGE